MHVCPDCNAPIEEHAKFCDNCGLLLASKENQAPTAPGRRITPKDRIEAGSPGSEGDFVQDYSSGTCSSCGYVNIPGEMFCQNCGVQLAPVISTPPPPPMPVSQLPAREDQVESPATILPQGLCTHCGFVNKPSEIYCQHCGLQLAHTDIPEAALSDLESLSKEKQPIAFPVPKTPIEAQLPVVERSLRGKLIVRETGEDIFLPLDKGEVLLGRADPVRNVYPDLDLTPYSGEKMGVSRVHAKIFTGGLKLYIEDLNSTNYTFLNRQKLTPGQRFEIVSGDEIRLGLLVLDFQME